MAFQPAPPIASGGVPQRPRVIAERQLAGTMSVMT
jgi:hypothetical protein